MPATSITEHATALKIRCPKCGAEPGERCWQWDRKAHCPVHRDRRTAAAAARRAEQAAEATPPASNLEGTIAYLVEAHGLGAVLEAAWDANAARWASRRAAAAH